MQLYLRKDVKVLNCNFKLKIRQNQTFTFFLNLENWGSLILYIRNNNLKVKKEGRIEKVF